MDSEELNTTIESEGDRSFLKLSGEVVAPEYSGVTTKNGRSG